ncbi:aldo/keto reductase [Methylobacterium radiotolerans]|nr:aldo/keto reductase [Methylobacterium radiotolerans]
MKYRHLGKTGLAVSELCFGAMTFGNKGAFLGAPDRNWSEFGVVEIDEAVRMVHQAIDLGINFFDTADVYKNGQGEEALGNALKGRRSDLIIGTKGRWATGPGPNELGSTRHHLIAAVDASLRRLQTDYIDLYHLHGFDPRTDIEETLRVLDDLVRWGKIRYIGVSNFAGWQLAKALGVSERKGLERFVCYQGYYNLAARELEHEIIPLCVEENVGITVWSPLAGGLLTGKYRRGEPMPAGSRLSHATPFESAPVFDRDQAFDAIEALGRLAAERDVSIAQAALNWVLRRPGVASVIIGATRPDQLIDNVNATDWVLTDAEVQQLNELTEREKPYPYWHMVNVAGDRRLPGDVYP